MRIKENGLGWYKISIGRNWGQSRARKFINNELPVKKLTRSLVASGESWPSARYIVSRIKAASCDNYGLYTGPGYIVVKGH